MFQVIDRAPSVGDRFAKAFGNVGKAASQLIPQHMAQKQEAANLEAMAKHLGTDVKDRGFLEQLLKNSGKAPPGGLSGQPVPPEAQSKISDVIKNNPNASTDELSLEMDKAGVPRAYSNSYIESRRRSDEANEKTFEKASSYQDEILKDYSAYRRDSDVLSQMGKIADRGNLPAPLLVQAFDSLGIPLGALNNPDSEQFSKLSQELVKNISGTYGNRILKVEVDNFLKSIPTLLNSDEGKKRLIQQWKIINEGKKAKYDAYREVEEEHPKKLPSNFKFLVQDKADKKLDKLSEEFRSVGLEQKRVKVPPGTTVTVQDLDRYLDLANDDVELAKKMAREDGYEF